MSQAPESITDEEFRAWLNAVKDWADKEGIVCKPDRCKFDGWHATLEVDDALGKFFVTVFVRGKRAKTVNKPAETDETFPQGVKLDCSHAICRHRSHRIKQLKRGRRFAKVAA